DETGQPLGIVHRDVSPSNIMVGYDGAVKLLDFGIAKATMRSVETQSGVIKGKFAYMAPEQCRGRDVDRRSDVFSLGIILYEISTQHRCFRADSDFDTMHRIVTGDVVRPTRLVHGYPPALEAIVMKALAIDANQRYQSGHQLLEALESFAVSARMSLSTMALGRFMREMFGEQQEPWLSQHRGAVVPQQESTISNTNSRGSEREIHRAPTVGTGPREPLPVAPSPRAPTSAEEPRDVAEWNAGAYPAGPPPEALVVQHPAIATPPLGSQPIAVVPHGTNPLAGQFASAGSVSGPSQGYVANELSYPRYEGPPPDRQLKPNRRPVFIGLGLIVVGLAVILALMIAKSGKDVTAADRANRSDPPVIETPSASVPPAVPPPRVPAAVAIDAAVAVLPDAMEVPATPDAADEPDDSSITIKIVSEPPGADVLLAGKVIGTTPLDRTIEKRDGQAILVVHRSGYADVETKIDLTADFEKTLTLVKLEDPPKPKEPKLVKKEPAKVGAPKSQAKQPPKKLQGCQPQGQYDPFNDPRPVCK
ncbi:MAG TPA: protein kinase, partial [Kofleriaceae bacterium]|nr:protein kinase [Kofleriaceae bacterium]